MKQLFLITLFLILITTPQALFAMNISEQQKQKHWFILNKLHCTNALLKKRNEAISNIHATAKNIENNIDLYDFNIINTLSKQTQCSLLRDNINETLNLYKELSEEILNNINFNNIIIENYELVIKNGKSIKIDTQPVEEALNEAKKLNKQLLKDLEKSNKIQTDLGANQASEEKQLKQLQEQKLTPATILITSSFITTVLGYCVYKFLDIFF